MQFRQTEESSNFGETIGGLSDEEKISNVYRQHQTIFHFKFIEILHFYLYGRYVVNYCSENGNKR